MAIADTITTLEKIAQQTADDTEIAALREAITYLTGVAFRSRALNIALDLCQGRYKNDYTDAYDSDVIVNQAREFEGYLSGKSGGM